MAEITRKGDIFILKNERVSYILAVLPGGTVAHLHAGARLDSINPNNLLRHAGLPAADQFNVQECALDRLMQEYPSFGLGDLKEGALAVRGADGTTAVDLRFESAEILPGKPALEGLPATFGENCQTLRLTLRDAHTDLETELLYTLFDDCDVVARSARLVNRGDAPLTVIRAMSFCLDLPDHDYELITLSGGWARERSLIRRPLVPGSQGVGSLKGASSAQASPFMALVRPETTERTGDAIGLSFIYSGNFEATADVGQYGTTRAMIGINDRDFAWRLVPGEAFQTPEAVMVLDRKSTRLNSSHSV